MLLMVTVQRRNTVISKGTCASGQISKRYVVINNFTLMVNIVVIVYMRSQGDTFDWTRDNGGTPSLTTGPSTDHTTGTKNGKCTHNSTAL